MDPKILDGDVQQFINRNLTADISQVALKKNPFPEIEWKFILNQIASKAKAKEKLPTWFYCDGIYYPEKISIEQSSSEATARYKSDLISGAAMIDLSGGYGVDDFYFAKHFDNVVHCEVNAELSEIAKHNFSVLKATNIKCFCGDGSQILSQLDQRFDWIYVDPGRRHDAKGKVFMLADCSPSIPESIAHYFRFSDNIMIKTSPLLDISAGLSELSNVKHIHVVAIKNEVKELLWMIENGFAGDAKITAVSFGGEGAEYFNFKRSDDAVVKYDFPQKYLYEPNAAILKAGAFAHVADRFGLYKLHPHSHLYTSKKLIEFPGRRFSVTDRMSYNKSDMKTLQGQKMNITTRNFPHTVEQIRKKWQIIDGGDCYSFFTTDAADNKIALICSKI